MLIQRSHVIDVIKTSAIADENVANVARIISEARQAASTALTGRDIDWTRTELEKLAEAPDTSALKGRIGGENQLSKADFIAAFERLERAFLSGRGLLPIVQRGHLNTPGGKKLPAVLLVSGESTDAIQAANNNNLDLLVAHGGNGGTSTKLAGVNERGAMRVGDVKEVVFDDGNELRTVPVEAAAEVVNGFCERYTDLWTKMTKPVAEKWVCGNGEPAKLETSAVTDAATAGVEAIKEEVKNATLSSLVRAPMSLARRSAAAIGAIVGGSIGVALGAVPDVLVHALTDLLPALTGFAALGVITLPRALRAGLGSRNMTPLLSFAGVHLARPMTLRQLS